MESTWHTVVPQLQGCAHPLGMAIKDVRHAFPYADHATIGRVKGRGFGIDLEWLNATC